MSPAYTGKHIRHLDPMKAIQLNVEMYAGDAGSSGLHHLIFELVDNAMDEGMSAMTKKQKRTERFRINVILGKDGSVAVEDFGRGIPYDWNEKEKVSAMTLVFTQLHAGAKFREEGHEVAYNKAGGLHGIGNKLVNATSHWLSVTVRRDGLRFFQKFVDGGKPVESVRIFDADNKQIGEIGEDTKITSKKGIAVSLNRKAVSVSNKRPGTRVHFLPDKQYFDGVEDWGKLPPWDEELLSRRFRQMVCLNPTIEIKFTDERKGTSETFRSDKGVLDLLSWMTEGLEPLPGSKPQYFAVEDVPLFKEKIGENDPKASIDVAFVWAGDEDARIEAFANNIPNPNGGTHVTGFKKALSASITQGLRKGKEDFRSDDFLTGLVAVVSVTMNIRPDFKSQTKEELTTPTVAGVVQSAMYPLLCKYLEKSGTLLRTVVAQAKIAADNRKEFAALRKVTLSGVMDTSGGVEFVPEKLKDVIRKGGWWGEPLVPKEYTVLYLIEGESAAGSCSMRNSAVQALYSLRGKIPNTLADKVSKVFQNREIQGVSASIGTGVGSEFDLSNMRYGRVSILTDADPDGKHIAALLLTFFYRFMPQLYAAHRITLAQPPLFRVTRKKDGQNQYCYSVRERDAAIDALGGEVVVQRYKGLGEMNPEQMRDTVLTIPPALKEAAKTKKAPPKLTAADLMPHELVVTQEMAEAATHKIMHLLMGKEEGAAGRREWMMKNIDW